MGARQDARLQAGRVYPYASSPSSQAPFRRHCHNSCTTLLADLLLLPLFVLVGVSVVPAARVLRGGVVSLRCTLPTSIYALRLGLCRPSTLHPPAPVPAAHAHLRICILAGGCPHDLTPPTSRPPAVSPTSHFSFRGGVYCADSNHIFLRAHDELGRSIPGAS
ncbi:hypothetical protein B0H14DRAFT_1683387 [Mycena olivaceomarginata]|nr:hypothetical protein B0H14DRAFT_1683387 [Mycena olivaceomarginata]